MLDAWEPPTAHPVWGLPLDQYLRGSENQVPSRYLQLGRIIESLNQLKTGSATCETFELCLSLVNDQNALRLIIREDLLAGCMTVLRRYCRENALFDHAYGLLCLRTLALIIQAALLECIDSKSLSTVTKDGRSHPVLTRTVAMVVQQWMSVEHDHHLRQKRHLRNLKWFRDPENGDQFTCLPAVGGMTADDIEFLLRTLSTNSEMCQQLFRSAGLQGFCSLLFVIWQKLLYINPIISQSVQLGNLVYRYWPRAYAIEHGVLRYMFIWSIGRLRDAGSTLRLISTSVGDLRAVIEAFIDKAYVPCLPDAEAIATHDVAGLTDFLVEGLTPEVVDMIVPLLDSLLCRAWDEIENGDPPDNEAIMRLTASTLMLLSRKFLKRLDWAALLPLLLDEIDLVNLLGRVLLLEVEVPESKVKNNPITLFRLKTTAAMRALHECAPELVAYTFNQKFDDWLKTLRWISFQHITDPSVASKRDQLRRKDVWMEVGSALGYDEKLYVCGNPRCPGGDYANIVCDQCKRVAYCSPGCQTQHWSVQGGNAHRLTCNVHVQSSENEKDRS